MRKRKIPVCFITDDAYVLPTLTAIESLFACKKLLTQYSVFVLTGSDLSERSRTAISAVHHGITVISEQVDPVFDAVSNNGRHVSKTALLKFRLPEIFHDYDQLLYIDSDVVIQKDLKRFMLTDLEREGVYAAVVETYSAPLLKVNPFDYLSVRHYFNSGVMLLNLKKMREDNIGSKLMDYRLNGRNHYMDQDALNEVFHDRVLFFPITYNLMYTSMYRFSPEQVCRLYRLPAVKTWDELVNMSYILHYSSSEKPWLYDNIWKNEIWYRYYCRLPETVRSAFPLSRVRHEKAHRPVESS